MLQAVKTEAELLTVWEETRHLGAGLLTAEAHAQLKAVGQAAKEKLTKGSNTALTPKP
jgi:hypothetical protein